MVFLPWTESSEKMVSLACLALLVVWSEALLAFSPIQLKQVWMLVSLRVEGCQTFQRSSRTWLYGRDNGLLQVPRGSSRGHALRPRVRKDGALASRGQNRGVALHVHRHAHLRIHVSRRAHDRKDHSDRDDHGRAHHKNHSEDVRV